MLFLFISIEFSFQEARFGPKALSYNPLGSDCNAVVLFEEIPVLYKLLSMLLKIFPLPCNLFLSAPCHYMTP